MGGKIKKEFVGIRAKTKSYLKDNNEDNYKSCLGATQLETKITQLEQNKVAVDII